VPTNLLRLNIDCSKKSFYTSRVDEPTKNWYSSITIKGPDYLILDNNKRIHISQIFPKVELGDWESWVQELCDKLASCSGDQTIEKKVTDHEPFCFVLANGAGEEEGIRIIYDDGTIEFTDKLGNIINDLTIYDMSKSTAFVPKKDNEIVLDRKVTNCVTGEVIEICLIKNTTDGTQTAYNEDGSIFDLTTLAPGVLEMGVEGGHVPLGNAQANDVVAATALAAAGIVVPPFAEFLYIEPSNGPLIYTLDGTAPDGTSDPVKGIRVPDGGRICIQGKKAIANLQVASLDGTTPVDVNVEFSNIYMES